MTRRSRAYWAATLLPMLRDGYTPRQMANALGEDYRSICRALRNIGHPQGRNRAEQIARAARMVELRAAGCGYDAIAAEMGLGSRCAVYGVLRRQGRTGQGKHALRGNLKKLQGQELADYKAIVAKKFTSREALMIIGRADLLDGV